jgi:hypothetical protein
MSNIISIIRGRERERGEGGRWDLILACNFHKCFKKIMTNNLKFIIMGRSFYRIKNNLISLSLSLSQKQNVYM